MKMVLLVNLMGRRISCLQVCMSCSIRNDALRDHPDLTHMCVRVVESSSKGNKNNLNESARHPISYMEVLEMLEKGEQPPGIRVRTSYSNNSLLQTQLFVVVSMELNSHVLMYYRMILMISPLILR